MSKLQHTPGPWITKGDGIVRVNTKHKYNSALKLGSGWNEDTWCDEDADEETLGNARLIAAAPDMLEALISVYQIYIDRDICCDNEFIKSVIEKATGMSIEEILK